MNLYREISAYEIIDHINLAFAEYGITDYEVKIKIEKKITTDSKRAAKQSIKESLPEYSWYDVQDLHKTLDVLYRGLGRINMGEKVYTDI
ncbi:metallopeptidase [Bacillus phage SWEP1]|nr:metallopeptidase [Bacillus phage SWEP1]